MSAMRSRKAHCVHLISILPLLIVRAPSQSVEDVLPDNSGDGNAATLNTQAYEMPDGVENEAPQGKEGVLTLDTSAAQGQERSQMLDTPSSAEDRQHVLRPAPAGQEPKEVVRLPNHMDITNMDSVVDDSLARLREAIAKGSGGQPVVVAYGVPHAPKESLENDIITSEAARVKSRSSLLKNSLEDIRKSLTMAKSSNRDSEDSHKFYDSLFEFAETYLKKSRPEVHVNVGDLAGGEFSVKVPPESSADVVRPRAFAPPGDSAAELAVAAVPSAAAADAPDTGLGDDLLGRDAGLEQRGVQQQPPSAMTAGVQHVLISRVNVWSEWGEWSFCTVSCGFDGYVARRRACMRKERNGCAGGSAETKACHDMPPCPHWMPWGAWTQCSVTCGAGGRRSRWRSCSHSGRCGSGDQEQLGACPLIPDCHPAIVMEAPPPQHRVPTHQELRPPRPIVPVVEVARESKWTQWADWSACSASCGSSGRRSRSRYCHVFSEVPCQGMSADYEDCPGQPPCPDLYSPAMSPVVFWSLWGPWSACAATCGGGSYEVRRRSCAGQAFWMCQDEEQHRACSLQPCIMSSASTSTRAKLLRSAWSEWQEWSACSTTCGPGSEWRHRKCDGVHVSTCEGKPSETRACHIADCIAAVHGLGHMQLPGQAASLHCPAAHGRYVSSIKWTLPSGKTVEHEGRGSRYQLMGNQLIIHDARRSDRGSYKCTALTDNGALIEGETSLGIVTCDTSPCRNGGECVNNGASAEGNFHGLIGFKCRCRSPYTGSFCQHRHRRMSNYWLTVAYVLPIFCMLVIVAVPMCTVGPWRDAPSIFSWMDEWCIFDCLDDEPDGNDDVTSFPAANAPPVVPNVYVNEEKILAPEPLRPPTTSLSFPDARPDVAEMTTEPKAQRDSFTWAADNPGFNNNADKGESNDSADKAEATASSENAQDARAALTDIRNVNYNCASCATSDTATTTSDQADRLDERTRVCNQSQNSASLSDSVRRNASPRVLLKYTKLATDMKAEASTTNDTGAAAVRVDEADNVALRPITRASYQKTRSPPQENETNQTPPNQAISDFYQTKEIVDAGSPLIYRTTQLPSSHTEATSKGRCSSQTHRFPSVTPEFLSTDLNDFGPSGPAGPTASKLEDDPKSVSQSSSLMSDSLLLESFPLCTADDLVPLIRGNRTANIVGRISVSDACLFQQLTM